MRQAQQAGLTPALDREDPLADGGDGHLGEQDPREDRDQRSGDAAPVEDAMMVQRTLPQRRLPSPAWPGSWMSGVAVPPRLYWGSRPSHLARYCCWISTGVSEEATFAL